MPQHTPAERRKRPGLPAQAANKARARRTKKRSVGASANIFQRILEEQKSR